MSDITIALVSGGSGLIGAVIGAVSANVVAHKNRESDRRKRCVDRVLAALAQLEDAFANYVAASASGDPDEPHIALPLQGAIRAFDQAVATLDVEGLRSAAKRYREQLKEFYLLYGQPRDALDAGRQTPTLQQINDEHAELCTKLRRYERKDPKAFR